MLVDTHCHLNDLLYEGRVPDVIVRAQRAGVGAFIVPSYDRVSLKRTAEIARSYRGVIFPAYGIHPWFLGSCHGFDEVLTFLESGDAVAVGEVGLDFSDGMPARGVQEKHFREQLNMAARLGLPAIIHCRKAYEALFAILCSYGKELCGVIHSYSGSNEMMGKFIRLGYFISFSGSLTRNAAKKYHRNAIEVPSDYFVLETDAPSIATETTLASQVEPHHVCEVARKFSALRQIPYEEVVRISTGNASRLFRLPEVCSVG